MELHDELDLCNINPCAGLPCSGGLCALPMVDSMKKDTDEMREDFERVATECGYSIAKHKGFETYASSEAELAWQWFQNGQASAEGKYLPVIEKASALAEMITRPYSGDPEDPSWTDIQDLAVNLRAEAAPLLKERQ